MPDKNENRDELTTILGQFEDQQQQLKQLVEYIPLSIAMFDTDMKYLVANRMWLEGYGLGDQKIIGKSHYDIFPEIGDDWKAIHQRCLAGDIDRNDRAPFPRADGRTDWLRWEVRPWYRKDGTIGGLVMYTEVITEQVELEQEREALLKSEQEARQKAEEAIRMRDLFLATMSHELRTPLNAIMGYLQLTIFSEELSLDNQYMIERTMANSKRLLRLINDILDLSRINSETLEVVPFDMSIAEVANTVEHDMLMLMEDKAIELIVDVDEAIPESIYHDNHRIIQILINLISNAVKFTDEGYVKVTIERQDEDLMLSVSDTGKGILPSHIEMIFDDFIQVDESQNYDNQSMGLGLAIVKRLTTLMNGTLNVESEINKGSTFTVTLPLNLPKGDLENNDG